MEAKVNTDNGNRHQHQALGVGGEPVKQVLSEIHNNHPLIFSFVTGAPFEITAVLARSAATGS
ncbi:hypothetical protein XA20_04795 [Lacticaseibacillus rhamnosus]|nr:hypothetical protein XA20_04795 [Lacticaseibacillus rhamnosus]